MSDKEKLLDHLYNKAFHLRMNASNDEIATLAGLVEDLAGFLKEELSKCES